MVIRFKSDSSGTAKGFSATYTVASAPPVTTTPTTTTKNMTTEATITTPVQTQTPAPEGKHSQTEPMHYVADHIKVLLTLKPS